MVLTQQTMDHGLCHYNKAGDQGHMCEGRKEIQQDEREYCFHGWQCPQQRELASFNSDVTLLTIINWSFNASWINKWVSWKNVAGEGRRGELQDQSALVWGGLGDASGESGLLLPGCAPNRKPALHTDTDFTNQLVFEKWLVGRYFCHSFSQFPYAMKAEMYHGRTELDSMLDLFLFL